MTAITRTPPAATTDSRDNLHGRAGITGLIWLTWRQHRWPIVISATITAGLTISMLITAARLGTLAQSCASNGCAGDPATTAAYATYQMNTVVFLPVLIAVFLGVPLLAREYEQRTLPLAWSQDISPLRWLAGKTSILGALVAAMGTILATAAEHLAHQTHAYTGTSLFDSIPFQAGGWLPLTLALAWLAFGIAAGAATRRTMPAIAVVVALWIGRQASMPRLRANFMTPVNGIEPLADTTRIDIQGAAPAPPKPPFHLGTNSLTMFTNNPPFVNSHGVAYSQQLVLGQWCSDKNLVRPTNRAIDPIQACLKQHDIVGTLIKYQPGSRLATFHTIENGANLTLLAASLLIAWWYVRKSRTTT
jgi:ABC-2 family transporter protein